MSSLVVSCQANSIKSFYHAIKKEITVYKRKANVDWASIEEARLKRKNSVVLGRIEKIFYISSKKQAVELLIQEVLYNGAHGKRFTAIIHNQLAEEFRKLKPEKGDQVGFFEGFVFENPVFSENNTTFETLSSHILEIKDSLIFCLKNTRKFELSILNTLPSPMLNPQNKPSLDKGEKSINPVENKVKSPSKRRYIEHQSSSTSNMPEDIQTPRKKPSIQLPLNPQIPGNTKRTNPQYKYSTVAQVKSNAKSGNLEHANMFVVVKEVIKKLSNTGSGKFTIICNVIDDSINKKELTLVDPDRKVFFCIHFFTPEDVILKQIEEGDILRLHRVKMELFNNDVDGRVFSSNAVMLFKSNTNSIEPITIAKKTIFTEDEKKRVEHLKKWYDSIKKSVYLLKEIRQAGVYKVFCKVASDPVIEDDKFILRVTDGTETSHLQNSFSLKRSHKSRNAVGIEIFQGQEEYKKLKEGDFVLLNEVNVTDKNGLHPCIYYSSVPYRINETSVEAMELKKRIALFDGKKVDHNEVETTSSEGKKDKLVEKPLCPPASCEKPVSKSGNVVEEHSNKDEDLGNGLKPRKALFNADYADLSDAAEEDTLEVLEGLKVSGGDQRNGLKEDVTPANTSFGDLIELVKTKYCSPRKLSGNEEELMDYSITKANHRRKDLHWLPPAGEVEAIGAEQNREGEPNRNTRYRKRMQHFANMKSDQVSSDDDDDDRTVINKVFQPNAAKQLKMKDAEMRTGSKTVSRDDNQSSSVLSCSYRTSNVENWLIQSSNSQEDNIRNSAETQDIDIREVIRLLDSKFDDSLDTSHFTFSPNNRCQLFLIEVLPDPTSEPLDLVSGFCQLGCHRFYLFSTLDWEFNEEAGESYPYCPSCKIMNLKTEVELIFLIEMRVMTTLGFHDRLTISHEQAEVFLGCSAREFVTNSVIRDSRVQMLCDNTLQNTKNATQTPLLDISVRFNGSTLCLVDSKLNH